MNTPIIFEIKAPPHFIHMSKRHFLTLDQINGIQIISFEGKILCTPKFQGLRPEYLVKEMISVSSEILAVVDSVDSKNIYILDAVSGKQLGKLTHNSGDIVAVCLNQFTSSPQER